MTAATTAAHHARSDRPGFGDITAKSETAWVVLIVQMLADLALLGAGARVLLGAVRRGQQRRSDTGGDADPAPQ